MENPVSDRSRPWILAAPARALPTLAPLIEAHREIRPVQIFPLPGGHVPSWTGLKPWMNGAAGALVVGNRRRSPRTVLPGMIVRLGGERIPLGWLPDAGEVALKRYATAAAAVLRRRCEGLPRGPIALLAQWDERALRLMRRAERFFRRTVSEAGVFCWTAERIVRRDLLAALRSGPGIVMYAGHGCPSGWIGYQGLYTRHLVHACGLPIGAVVSICCETASRRQVSLSFCEEMVLGGIAGAAVGAVTKTAHLANRRWTTRICQALAGAPTSVGALMCASMEDDEHVSDYRIIGDPLMPLIGAASSLADARVVIAPAAGDRIAPNAEGAS